MDDKKFLPVIIFALGIILTVSWYEFIYTPVQREILNMGLETRRLHEVERGILTLKTRYGDLVALGAKKELELDAMRNFLPVTLLQDEFIDNLYWVADLNKVQVASVQAGEMISDEKIQSQVVSVKLEAEYISLLNFMRDILDGERLVRLEDFFVKSTVGNIISCELNFKIFAAAP